MNSLSEPAAFAGASPAKPDPILTHVKLAQDTFKYGDTPPRLVVAIGVMAIAGMAPTNQHAVTAAEQSPKDIKRIEAAAAHQPDDSYVRRVLHSRCPGQVGPGIGTPVTEKRNYSWLKFF
jgi:hypothetical protein